MQRFCPVDVKNGTKRDDGEVVRPENYQEMGQEAESLASGRESIRRYLIRISG